MSLTALHRRLQDFFNQISKLNAILDFDYFLFGQKETDKSLMYLFWIFQQVQNSIISTLGELITKNFISEYIWLGVQCSLLLLILFLWGISIEKKKNKIASIYGSVVLVPNKMVLQNKRFIKKAENVINII